MKYTLILLILFCLSCKKEITTPENKSKTPYYLEMDSTTINGHENR